MLTSEDTAGHSEDATANAYNDQLESASSSNNNKESSLGKRCHETEENAQSKLGKRRHNSDDFRPENDTKKKKDQRHEKTGTVPDVYKAALYRNYKQLKMEMDIENLVNGLPKRNRSLSLCGETRTLKADKLLSEIERLLDETEDTKMIFEGFLHALGRSNRELEQIVQSSLTSSTADLVPDFEENERLYSNFQKQRTVLAKEVEPKTFIDDVVELGGLNFSEHFAISKAQNRTERIKILFGVLDKLPQEQKWKILAPMYKLSAKDIEGKPDMRPSSAGATAVIEVNFSTGEDDTGPPVAVISQDTQPHENRKLLFEDLRRCSNNLSPEIFKQRLNNITAIFGGTSINSLNFHLTDCSAEDIKKIKQSYLDGGMKTLLLSMLDESAAETLNALGLTVANINVYISNESKVCLCYLNKQTFEKDIGYWKIQLGEYKTQLIDRLIKCKLLPAETTNSLIGIKRCEGSTETMSRLITFLRQDDVPQICFCMLESIILEMDRQDIIHRVFDTQKRKDIDIETKVEITSETVLNNVELLAEEIDAKWFIHPLNVRDDKKEIPELIEKIKTSKSRRERTMSFIEFLCQENDLSWFKKKLASHHDYLLGILSTQIKTSTAIVKELRNALIVLSDMIQDDLDPLEIRKYLRSSLKQRLPFGTLENEASRQKRASIFLEHIIKDENDTTIPEVIEAMRNGYNDLVTGVRDVVQKGSLSKFYKCPRIKDPQCVFHARIDFTENLRSRELSAPGDGNGKEREGHTVTSQKGEDIGKCDWHLYIVKQYSLIKEELLKSSAEDIAKSLLKQDLLTQDEVDSISNCSRRRKAVEKLLKMVLNGTYDMYNAFKAELHQLKMSPVLEKLNCETASDREKRVFNMLEMSSEQNCPRPDSHEPRLKFERSEYQTLIDELNKKNVLDEINDQLLSRQIFSIQEHSRVVGCSFKKSVRSRQLIETLQLCSENVLPTFVEILYLSKMTHVAEKLERKRHSRDEKPRGKLLNAPIEERIVTSIQRRQRFTNKQSHLQEHDPTILSSDEASRSPVSYDVQDSLQCTSLQRSDSNSSLQSLEKLGFDIDEVRPGSIVIMMRPKGPTSFQKLQNSCRTGQIKNFIPEIFADKELQNSIVAGEYRMTLTIYVIHSLDKPDVQKLMLRLENEEELQGKRVEKDDAMKKHVDILSEELDITDGLLDVLKKGNIVDDKIKADLSTKNSRREQTIYLVQKIMSHGKKGYDLLKGYLKDTNKYLYKYMDTHDNVMEDNPRSRSTAEYSKEDIVFSCTVVLRIKKREAEKVHGVERADLVITCPTILNPVLKFNGKEKKKCKQVKSSAKRSSTAKPEIR